MAEKALQITDDQLSTLFGLTRADNLSSLEKNFRLAQPINSRSVYFVSENQETKSSYQSMCTCNLRGTTDFDCSCTGQCNCDTGYTGLTCMSCDSGYYLTDETKCNCKFNLKLFLSRQISLMKHFRLPM